MKSGTYAIEELTKDIYSSVDADKMPYGLSRTASSICAKQLPRSYDSKYGGFGSPLKFPRPVEIQLMLYHSKKLRESGKTSEAEEG
ncbi:unnamed protein product [Cochlearia groenlandica]